MAIPTSRFVATLILALLLSSCATLIAQRIAQPPRLRIPTPAHQLPALEKAGSHLEFFARPGEPRIAYAVIEPGNYRLWYEFRADPGIWTYRMDYRAAPRPAPPPRGTVVLLHGWSTAMPVNLHWALALAERGYRCVLVDLRNHGESDAAPAGFGAREATDVNALIVELRRQQRIGGPLSIFGVSMGAVVAVHVAANDPGVRALVALEPYANAADAVRSAGIGFTGIPGVERGLRRYVTPALLERITDRLGHRLDLDLRRLDTVEVLARVNACTVVIHGQHDSMLPVHSSRGLGAGQANVQRLELPNDGHFSTPARLDLLADPLAEWLDAAAASHDECPRLRVYAYGPIEGVRNILPR